MSPKRRRCGNRHSFSRVQFLTRWERRFDWLPTQPSEPCVPQSILLPQPRGRGSRCERALRTAAFHRATSLFCSSLLQAISLFSRSSPPLPKEISARRIASARLIEGGGWVANGVCCHNMQARDVYAVHPLSVWRVCTLDYPQHIETLVKITRRITTAAADAAVRERQNKHQVRSWIVFVSIRGLAISTEFNASPSARQFRRMRSMWWYAFVFTLQQLLFVYI
jgi:hypothetical protein